MSFMLPVNSSWDEFECKCVCISEPARKLHDEKEQRLNIKQKHTNTTRGEGGYYLVLKQDHQIWGLAENFIQPKSLLKSTLVSSIVAPPGVLGWRWAVAILSATIRAPGPVATPVMRRPIHGGRRRRWGRTIGWVRGPPISTVGIVVWSGEREKSNRKIQC